MNRSRRLFILFCCVRLCNFSKLKERMLKVQKKITFVKTARTQKTAHFGRAGFLWSEFRLTTEIEAKRNALVLNCGLQRQCDFGFSTRHS